MVFWSVTGQIWNLQLLIALINFQIINLIDGILEVTLDLAWLWQQLCMLDMVGNIFTVQLLELGHFKEDYSITTFFENKRFSSFLQMNQQHSWLWELLLEGSGKFTRFKSFQQSHSWTLNFIDPFAKKLENLLF